MVLANDWTQYKILATGNGEKLEDWNGVILMRPDPQIIWQSQADLAKFEGLAARYVRKSTGGGAWDKLSKMPDEWDITYKDLTFRLKPMGFKHTGLFPEQAANWDNMRALIKVEHDRRKTLVGAGTSRPTHSSPLPSEPVRVLNLFAYTGGATIACAKEGAQVTHVDAAKGMVDRAKTNAALSKIPSNAIRWIVDDCKKFIEREHRRGQTYDAIIMDPPSYGRGAGGEVWKLEDSLFELMTLAAAILTPNPLFFLINSYTTGLGATVMANLLHLSLKNHRGHVTAYELGLPTQETNIVLPCGNSAMWTKDKT